MRSLDADMVSHSGIAWSQTAMIQGGPVHGVSPVRMVVSLLRLVVGLLQALWWMLRWRPDRVFLTGGWVCLPVAAAAWICRVPVVAFVPDIEPGLTLKTVGRFARKIAATTSETAAFFRSGQVVATGYPLRQDVLQATREAGIHHFDLDPAKRTLLVTGGSLGSRNINRALLGLLPDLLTDETLQVLHVTGTLDWSAV